MGDRPTEKLQFYESTTARIVIGMWSGDRLKMRIKVEAVIFAKNLLSHKIKQSQSLAKGKYSCLLIFLLGDQSLPPSVP
jgi:hypothetical protein